VKGEREAARRKLLRAANRCVGCADKLAFDDIGRFHYCAKCRADGEAEMWRLHCEGTGVKEIAQTVKRSGSTVSTFVRRMEKAQTDPSNARHDDTPRCKCGLRIDADHLVCDMPTSAVAYIRAGTGATYPGNGWNE
jgi:hypothetical protein